MIFSRAHPASFSPFRVTTPANFRESTVKPDKIMPSARPVVPLHQLLAVMTYSEGDRNALCGPSASAAKLTNGSQRGARDFMHGWDATAAPFKRLLLVLLQTHQSNSNTQNPPASNTMSTALLVRTQIRSCKLFGFVYFTLACSRLAGNLQHVVVWTTKGPLCFSSSR